MKSEIIVITLLILVSLESCHSQNKETINSISEIRFLVVGDTQGNGKNPGYATIIPQLIKDMEKRNPDFVVFTGDLVGTESVKTLTDWKDLTSVFGNNRYMVPGNHDLPGRSATNQNWIEIFPWLKVGGMESGNYNLLIENDTIAIFSNVELLQGVELQNNSKTPQYRQAQKIASLNAKRNGTLYALRDLWTAKKNLRNVKAELELKPNDPKLIEKIEGLKKQLDDFDNKEEKILAKALKLQEEIYEVNQPKNLNYQLM